MAWIYLPKKSGNVIVLRNRGVASSEVSSQGSGLSAMSNGASTANKFSRKGSRTEFSTMPLSGMTSGHSTGKDGVALWTSLLRASRARRSVLRGRGWERVATRTCGLIPFAIGEVKPEWCPVGERLGLLSSGYFGEVLSGLAEVGYDTRWGCLSASSLWSASQEGTSLDRLQKSWQLKIGKASSFLHYAL